MVKLIASLLAVTLATGSAIASSNKYQRHSVLDVNNQMQPHGLQEHDQEQVVRRPRTRLRPRIGIVAPRKHARAFKDDDLEAREPFRVPAGTLKGAAKKRNWGSVASGTGDVLEGVDSAIGIASGIQNLNSRSFEYDEDLFGREPSPAGTLKGAAKKRNWGSVASGTGDVLSGVDSAIGIADGIQNLNSRSFEYDEDLFGREPSPAGSSKGAARKPKWGNVISGTGDVLGHVNTAVGIASGIQDMVQSRSLESPNAIRARRIKALLAAQNSLGQWGLLDGRDTFDDLD